MNKLKEKMLLQSIPNDVWDRIKKADSKRWVPPKINIEKFMKKYNPVDRTIALKPDLKRSNNE